MKYSVLLVDDSEGVLRSLQRTLRLSGGYDIYLAESARDALNLMSDVKIDMVITDHKMPEMTGTELLNTIRTLYPETIRIMLTGESDMNIAKEAINNGAIYRFFTKPWDDYELLISIRHAFLQKEIALERESGKTQSSTQGR